MSHSAFPEFIDLPTVAHVQGEIALPGSKSISNRTLLLAALAHGTTHIHDLLASDDTTVMLNALTNLGVKWQQQSGTQNFVVEGTGGHFPNASADLFMGNAGTAIRPLVGALAVLGGDYSVHAANQQQPQGNFNISESITPNCP